MTPTPTFQSIILALEHFWAEHGCLIWQPYYSQVGAGTMNPGTFLRVLGPEPWNVAYVEPSIRPDDGRYGENPNRFQQHYQYQVILKPDPGNPQELYLQSLEALGLDLRRHDLRFVEDNWESPALGAWGLGWEVWLDGQEITQFTYFQQAGGLPCDPVSVELTYGLERILIALRNAGAIWDEPWTGGITYGDVNLKGEYEHSKYYFEIADVERLRQMYALFDAECRAALAAGLVLPAYDYLLKCSHTFNVLDTRGAVGVTERAGFFGKMRGLAREVSEAYVAQRQQMEYPLLKAEGGRLKAEGSQRREMPIAQRDSSFILHPSAFLLEIGVEELPAADLDSALAQLAQLASKHLDAARLGHERIDVFGTPRRLVMFVHALAPRQADSEQTVKGPPADRAFDSDGNPTKAATGFARKNGVPVEALEVRELDGGKYVVAVVREAGRPAPEALAEVLPGLVAALAFDKSMRWNESAVAFSRPIRWFVALLGDAVIPFEYAGVQSGRASAGLRRLGPPEIEIPDASAYFDLMKQHGILVDAGERRQAIAKQVAALAREVGGTAGDDPALLDEVTNLVEMPTALRGSFDEAYLELPQDVLVSVMKKHQRYFPVAKNGNLMPYFIAVRNGDAEGLGLVRQGNEHVIGARFADARFFVREDLKQPLESFRAALGTLTFQVKLGSMLDKAERIERLAAALAPRLGLTEAETQAAVRAAHLCKADLATSMVVEMTSLQGIMGREYAVRSGEPPQVAQAIFEHYLPRSQGDALPQSKPGIAVGLADRLDSLAGLFAAGLAPTGSADPFALRRAALGVVQVLLDKKISFSVREGLRLAAEVQPIAVSSEVVEQAAEFVQGRLRAYLLDQAFRYDEVDAVLAARGDVPLRALEAVEQLARWTVKPDWGSTLAAYARCVRITRDQAQTFPVSPEALADPAEKSLFAAYQAAAAKPRASVDEFLNALLPMIPAISQFFEDVLVMAEERAVRENRLGLLQAIAALADGVADFSKLEGF